MASSRLPGLDGLRAGSILLVLVAHLAGTRGCPLPAAGGVHLLGGLGVRVFFVISGFLITSLLLGEVARTGTISLGGFYIRRTYRIFPAFYAYLAVVAVLAAGGLIVLADDDLLCAATYTMNFHRPRSWYVGHLWSLSVEEQFYLVWPAIMLFASRRVALAVAAAAVVAAPLVRVGTFVLLPDHRDGINETFPTVFDALAMGCLLAGHRDWLEAHPVYARFERSPFFAIVPLLGIAALLVPRVSFEYAIGITILNLSIALTIHWVVRRPDTALGRLLELAPVAWLGRLSYSLYLWQQPFVNRAGTHWIQAFPANVVLAFACAVVSHTAIEQPFLRLRDRRARSRAH